MCTDHLPLSLALLAVPVGLDLVDLANLLGGQHAAGVAPLVALYALDLGRVVLIEDTAVLAGVGVARSARRTVFVRVNAMRRSFTRASLIIAQAASARSMPTDPTERICARSAMFGTTSVVGSTLLVIGEVAG